MRFRIGLICLLLWPLLSFSNPLPEAQVFQFQFARYDANTLKLDWDIKNGYFLYKERIHIKTPPDHYMQVGTLQFPPPLIKISKQGKQILVYRNTLTLAIPLLANSGGESLVTVEYQGCSDEGFCYPPQTKNIQVSFDKNHTLTEVKSELDITNPQSSETIPHRQIHSSQEVRSLFVTASPIWVILSFFGFGLLLAFTPCVLPMVPVLSSIIVGHGHKISTRKAFLLSLSYVLSMSFTYGLIGAVIALLGANLQVLLQSTWVIGGFSLVFVALALSMFNVFEFRLPMAWQTYIAKITRSHEGGHYLNAGIMGSMSILILSPCVTPPLIGALSYIAEAGSVILGLSALFCLGLGMGMPLLLLGASAGKLLPKAGQWMNTIKYIFGMLLLGLAIHLFSRIASPHFSMLLWSALFIASGLGFRPFFPPQTGGRAIIIQAIGIMLIIYGGFILYGASAGHTNPWQPLKTTERLNSILSTRKTITTVIEAEQVLVDAATAQLPVLLDFYATWCDSCQHIEQRIMHAPALRTYDDRIVIAQVDLSKNDADAKALLQYFHVIAPPTFLFYDDTGTARPDLQWVGTIDLRTLLARIRKVISASSNAI